MAVVTDHPLLFGSIPVPVVGDIISGSLSENPSPGEILEMDVRGIRQGVEVMGNEVYPVRIYQGSLRRRLSLPEGTDIVPEGTDIGIFHTIDWVGDDFSLQLPDDVTFDLHNVTYTHPPAAAHGGRKQRRKSHRKGRRLNRRGRKSQRKGGKRKDA